MKKGQFKLQASSSRVSSASLGSFGSVTPRSSLSYYTEHPDLSSIVNPHIVVAFKNLNKKDDSTRSRSLQDLRTHINFQAKERNGIDDPVIEAWVNIYPRLSIDPSRIVRDQSHAIQHELLSSSQKRMAVRVSRFVSSWLAGQFDRDRIVASNVRKAIKSLLPSDEKLVAFYIRHHATILNYAYDTIQETPETLSDERSMSKADMMTKYFIMLGPTISLVLDLLQRLDEIEISKIQENYNQFISNKKLWSLVSCEDPNIRRTICDLLIECCQKQRNVLSKNLEILTKAFISKGLLSSQQGSASKLVNAIQTLTDNFPGVWELNNKSKKSRKLSSINPLKELKSFILAGPQLEGNDFWKSLEQLFTVLPLNILPQNEPDSTEFLQNLRTSISRKGGMRAGMKTAWECYLKISEILFTHLADSESKVALLKNAIFPLFNQYLNDILPSDQSVENANNSTGSEIEMNVAVQAYIICLQYIREENSFSNQWNLLGNGIIEMIKTSLPEQAKNFRSSQDSVLALSKKWFSLLAEVLKYDKRGLVNYFNQDPLFMNSIHILKTALDVMILRDGKPYCAAGILEDAVSRTPILFTSDPDRLMIIQDLLKNHLPKVLSSPSASFVIPIIFQLPNLSGLKVEFEKTWNTAVETLLSKYESSTEMVVIEAAQKLISDESVTLLAQKNQKLQEFLLKQFDQFVFKNRPCMPIINSAVCHGVLSESSAKTAINSLIYHLNENHEMLRIIHILSLLNSHMHHLFDIKNDNHMELLLKLLKIRENALLEQGNESELAMHCQTLKHAIIENSYVDSISQLITENLKKKGKDTHCIFVGQLIHEAKDVIEKTKNLELLDKLLPSTEDWFKDLYELLDRQPKVSLAALSEIGSIVYPIQKNFKPVHSLVKQQFDTHGLTMPLRKAIYSSDLIFSLPLGTLSLDFQIKLLEIIILTFEVAESDTNLQENILYSKNLPTGDEELMNHFIQSTPSQLQLFVARLYSRSSESELPTKETSGVIVEIERNKQNSNSFLLWGLIKNFLSICELLHPVSCYAAKALGRVLKMLPQTLEADADLEKWLLNQSIIRPSTSNIVGASAILIGLGQRGKSSKLIKNLCNQLISNLLSLSPYSDDTNEQLVLINSCLTIYDGEELPVAQNRIIFSVKHVVSWTDNLVDTCLISEVLRLLKSLLPLIKSIYGSFWESCIAFCNKIWAQLRGASLHDENLVMVIASMRLYSKLREIEESNEDLSEALLEFQGQTSHNLLELLFVKRTSNIKPLQEVDKALATLIFKISCEKFNDVDRFYPLLASEYFWVQSAGFVIIQRHLPVLQQQISVDVLLENKDASFPSDLLSLIMTTPNFFDMSTLPANFQCISLEYSKARTYLLAWLLVFENFAASSFKVRSDFNKILKFNNCIGPLMDFIFQALGHIDEKPLDPKKQNLSPAKIRQYDFLPSISHNDVESDFMWMLVNLYYKSLKYAPNIVKSWWLDSKKKIKNSVCRWTEKHISPLLTEEELDAVTLWAESQESHDGEQNLIVRVAKNVREVSVGYEIDDMTMRILIRVPENYPLDLTRVESINRIGISEQKWNSFLMTTNGVINFSNGSISDSLLIFRKNVIGAFKGQVECAICYSIISADRKVPDKKCGTCHNIFHSKCLFQWFKSSNQSNCPLCRNSFNY